MKRKLWVPIILMLACEMLSACQDTGKVTGSERMPENEETRTVVEQKVDETVVTTTGQEACDDAVIPEHEILLVYRYSNSAWGIYNNGYVIDTDGCVYQYDYAKDGFGTVAGENVSFTDYLEYILENSKGTPVFDREFVKQIFELGANLSADDQFDQTHEMCDYGQETLYFYQPQTKELLWCESRGDVHYKPQNESAAKIVELLQKIIMDTAVEVQYDEDGLMFVKNQLLVYTYPGTDEEIMEKLVGEIEADIIEYIPDLNYYQLEFRKDTPYDELMKYVDFFLAHPFVMDADLNYYSLETQPD